MKQGKDVVWQSADVNGSDLHLFARVAIWKRYRTSLERKQQYPWEHNGIIYYEQTSRIRTTFATCSVEAKPPPFFPPLPHG